MRLCRAPLWVPNLSPPVDGTRVCSAHDLIRERESRGCASDARDSGRGGLDSKGGCLLRECAGQGVQLAVLPEAFVSVFPSNSWARGASDFSGWDELWERLWANSVDVPGPLVDELGGRLPRTGIHCAIGVNERESGRPGTIYNALLLLGPKGLLHRHRKLMPTHQEKLFYGIGSGDDLGVTETPFGRVGGLICWENRMPLARYAVYKGGPQIWIAPTGDDSDGWLASMRHIAIESGAFVVSVPQYIPRSAFPDDFPAPPTRGQGSVRQRWGGDRRARAG